MDKHAQKGCEEICYMNISDDLVGDLQMQPRLSVDSLKFQKKVEATIGQGALLLPDYFVSLLSHTLQHIATVGPMPATLDRLSREWGMGSSSGSKRGGDRVDQHHSAKRSASDPDS